MITLTTLRDFARDHDLHCFCHACAHSARLPWMILAQRYGWDFPVSGIAPRLVCRACGGRNSGISLVFNRARSFNYRDHSPNGANRIEAGT